jgi:FkbM family methyltransferase
MLNAATFRKSADGVILYGAGSKGRAVRESLGRLGIPVLAFIDQHVCTAIDGTAVLQPTAAELRDFARNGTPVIVSVFNAFSPPTTIHAVLQGIGFDTIIGFMELCQLVDPGNTYWLSYCTPMIPEEADASWLENRLHDDTSRRILTGILEARRSGDILLLSEPTPDDQYFPKDVPLPKGPLHFVDVGAFEGETLFALAANGFVFSRITAFEPDLISFAKLASALSQNALCDDISLLPCGLSDKSAFVSFQSLGQPSSACGQGGSATALVVALDDVLHGPRVDYIKFDIEGAEAQALEGCKNIIREHRPAMAVAVYHRPADLWRIPRLVDAFLPQSRFYLRSHGHHGFELVLYVTP